MDGRIQIRGSGINCWYVSGEAGRNDILKSAEKSAGRTGKAQVVHEHEEGAACRNAIVHVDGEVLARGCIIVEPGNWPPSFESVRAAQRLWT